MFKNPWRKDGSVRYVELIKYTVMALFLIMGFSLYLETVVSIGQFSGTLSSMVLVVFFIHMFFVNYDLFKSIVTLLSQTIITFIKRYEFPFERGVVFVVSFIKQFVLYGFDLTLKYRVIRV